MKTAVGRSELEWNRGHFEVLIFPELIFECGEELGVDFEGELFQVFNLALQVFLFVAGPLLHLTIPRIVLLDALCRQDESGGGQLRGLML